MRSFPSSGESFWNVALECALRRNKKQCRAVFDDDQCQRCRVYLRKYTHASEQAIQMLMLHADSAAEDDKIRERFRRVRYAALALLIIGFAVWGWADKPRKAEPPTELTTSYVANQDIRYQIDWTLRRVAEDLNRRVDYNRDGKVNCIDAAVSFYKHFPTKSHVHIMLNYNTNVSPTFNHLFNIVWVDDRWRGIEPQTYWLGRKDYFMMDHWKARYDGSLNENQTDKYKVFAN